MRNILIFTITFLFANQLVAQQEFMVSRYMFSNMYLSYNPAYSGTHGYWTSSALYRTQWVGFDGGPQTIYFGAEGLVGKRENAGVGFSLYHDKIGLDRMTDFSASYAYHLRLNEEHTFAIGIKGGAFLYKSLLGSVDVWQPGDPIYAGDVNGVVPHGGLGLYYYTADYFVGLSVPTLFSIDKRAGGFNFTPSGNGIQQAHYYGHFGYVFHLRNDIDLKPSILLKYEKAAPLEADFNLNVWFKDLFSVGASYRTNDAVSVMVEIPIGKKLSVGYAYDQTITDIQNVSSGSHEIMVRYNFANDNDKKVRPVRNSPNRF